jgi:hypothetical protein
MPKRLCQIAGFNFGFRVKSAVEICMSVTVEVDLPESVVAEARAKGLLEPKRVASLIARESNLHLTNHNLLKINMLQRMTKGPIHNYAHKFRAMMGAAWRK